MTIATKISPATPTQDPRSTIRAHPKPSTARIATSQPSFGPSVPLSVTAPSTNQVEKTPTSTSASAARTTHRCRPGASARPGVAPTSGCISAPAWAATLARPGVCGRDAAGPSPRSCSQACSSSSTSACWGSRSSRVGRRRRCGLGGRRPGGGRGVRRARATRPSDARCPTPGRRRRRSSPGRRARASFRGSSPTSRLHVVGSHPDVRLARGRDRDAMARRPPRSEAGGGSRGARHRRRYGSRPFGPARAMFTRLADAGAQIVVNDTFPWDRDGLYPDHRSFDWRQDEVGRADHRKLYVIDGNVAWTGGAGIEDHFANGKFHDVMVRVTGNVVRQAQAALPDELPRATEARSRATSRSSSPPASAGEDPDRAPPDAPGGLRVGDPGDPGADRHARTRLDVMNPYFTDADMVQRISRPPGAASRCGSSSRRPRTTPRRPPRSSTTTRPDRAGATSRSTPALSSTPSSSSPTTPSSSAPSTSTPGRSTATTRSR